MFTRNTKQILLFILVDNRIVGCFVTINTLTCHCPFAMEIYGKRCELFNWELHFQTEYLHGIRVGKNIRLYSSLYVFAFSDTEYSIISVKKIIFLFVFLFFAQRLLYSMGGLFAHAVGLMNIPYYKAAMLVKPHHIIRRTSRVYRVQ